ncbi:MAG: hypothetical protein WC647_18555 [Desulfomonilaceae bacterium]|jgi:hypothetical protein
MKRELNNVLKTFSIEPVLIDIGASGQPPELWEAIASQSLYIGFDPDLREMRDIPGGKFARTIILNEAVTSNPEQTETKFYLTQSPHCSSTLPPDNESLANYLFSDLFAVQKEVSVNASSLNAAIDRLGLKGVDWFKTDSQGTDLRLFQSLDDNLRNRVLAIDIEPGLIDAYQGEDLFIDAHRALLGQGFWLSKLDVKGTVRLKRTTFQAVVKRHPKFTDTLVYSSVQASPGWCEASYLRTLASIQERDAQSRDYTLLWVFAMIEKQWGYGLDIALAYDAQFGPDDISKQMSEFPLKQIYRNNRNFRTLAKRLLPEPVKKLLRKLIPQ